MDEEDIKRMKWEEIRDYYKKKKENWGSRKRKKFGRAEPSDFTLESPYTVEEVEKYETTIGVKLPADFKTYLIEVSRELIVAHPTVCHLTDRGQMDTEFKIPPEKDYWSFQPCLIHDFYPQQPPQTTENENVTCGCNNGETGGLKMVGEGGCDELDWLVIKGTQVGSVWHDGGTDSLRRTYESFWDYLYTRIKKAKEGETRLRNRAEE